MHRRALGSDPPDHPLSRVHLVRLGWETIKRVVSDQQLTKIVSKGGEEVIQG